MANKIVGRFPAVVHRAAQQALAVTGAGLPPQLEEAIAADSVDAFTAAVGTLLPMAKVQDARFLVLLESALRALGADPQALGPSVTNMFAQASSSSVWLSPQRRRGDSPLLDVLKHGMLLPGVLRHELARYHIEQDFLLEQVKEASTAEDPVGALRVVEAHQHDLTNAPNHVPGALIEAFMSAGACADAARVYEHAHPDFRALDHAQNLYARALLLHQDPFAAAVRLAAWVPEGVLALDDETRGTLHLEQALSTSSKREGTALLLKATAELRAAVQQNPHGITPAVDLMRAYLAQGKPQMAHAVAQIVAANAENLMRWRQADAADLSAGAAALHLLGRIDDARAMASAALDAPASTDPWRSQRARRATDSLLPAHIAQPGLAPALAPTDAKLLDKTYGFAASKARVFAGNFKYGGISHDTRFSPENLRFFTRVLDEHQLLGLTDEKAVNEKIDEIVREHFHTSTMEDAGTAEHQVYDETLVGLKEVIPGSRGRSVTDVAADWLLKLGDCRQHGAVKCALALAWRSAQRAKQCERFLEASERGEKKQAGTAMAAIDALDRTSLRILEIAVVKDAPGQADDGEVLEEHVSMVSVSVDAGGTLHARRADAFFQEVYNLGHGELTVSVTSDGKLRLAADDLARKSDGQKIRLESVPYSGDRGRPDGALPLLSFRGRELAAGPWWKTAPLSGFDFGALTSLARPAQLNAEMAAFGGEVLGAKGLPQLVEVLTKWCPEMLWLTGNTRATPEAFAANVQETEDIDAGRVELWLSSPQFANNVMGTRLLCALLTGDYEAFTGAQMKNVRLSRASFASLAEQTRAGVITVGRADGVERSDDAALALGLATLTSFGTFKDLPKIEVVKQRLDASLGDDVASSPEKLMHAVLHRQREFSEDPSAVDAQALTGLIAAPTFEGLPPPVRAGIVDAFGADFNLGQLLQLLEFPAVKLHDLMQLPPDVREMVLIEGMIDIAGVKGATVRNGSATMTEAFHERYVAAREALLSMTRDGVSPKDAMQALVAKLTSGLGLDLNEPLDLMVGKIAVALDATTPEFCAQLRRELVQQLPPADLAFLIGEMNETGLTRRAIIPRNLPGLMRNLERSLARGAPSGDTLAKVRAATAGLSVTVPLLREVRADLQAKQQSDQPGTYQIDLLSLAAAAGSSPYMVTAGAFTPAWRRGRDGAELTPIARADVAAPKAGPISLTDDLRAHGVTDLRSLAAVLRANPETAVWADETQLRKTIGLASAATNTTPFADDNLPNLAFVELGDIVHASRLHVSLAALKSERAARAVRVMDALLGATDIAAMAKIVADEFPEATWLTGDVHASPYVHEGTGPSQSPSAVLFGKKHVEFDRTTVGIMCFLWSLKGDYESFTACQPDDGKRLSRAGFEHLRASTELMIEQLARETGTTREEQELLVVFTVLNDLGKIKAVVEQLHAITGEDEIDHDANLHALLTRAPEISPSFHDRIWARHQRNIIDSLRSAFNMGQLMLGENVAKELEAVRAMSDEGFLLYMAHFIYDWAGAAGGAVTNGSVIVNGPRYDAFNKAYAVLVDYRAGHIERVEDVYDAFLELRTGSLGLKLPAERALAKLCCMLAIFDRSDVDELRRAFARLPTSAQATLTQELSRAGTDDGWAIRVYYAPAVLGNTVKAATHGGKETVDPRFLQMARQIRGERGAAVDPQHLEMARELKSPPQSPAPRPISAQRGASNKVDAMTSALSILERVYRQARGQLKARPGSGVFTVDVKELADHLGKAQVAADLGFRLEAVGPNAQLRMASSGGRAG